MVRPHTTMEDHPDIVAMRDRYDMIASTSTAQTVEGATMLAGIYLAISPWVIGFGLAASDLAVNNFICGVAVGLLAVGYASAYGRTHGLSWVAPILGDWAIVSPWVILGEYPATRAVVSNVICGAAITLLGLATLAMGRRRAGATERHARSGRP